MTLDELIALAKAHLSGARRPGSVVDDLAAGIVDLFSEIPPCGWPEIELVNTRIEPARVFAIEWESLGGARISAGEARWIGVEMIRAADEADEENAE